MDDPSGSSLAILISTTLILSAFCKISKNAYTSFSYAKVDELLQSEKAKIKLKNYVTRGSELLIATSVFGSLSTVTFTICIILLFSNSAVVKSVYLLYSLPLCFFSLLFIDILSLYLSHRYSEKIVTWALPVMSFLYWLGIIFVWPLSRFVQFLDTIFIKDSTTSSAIFERAILDVVSKGEEEGIFQGSEKNMIEAIIDLREVLTREIMTPRTDVMGISIDESVSKALAVANKAGFSRIPIYRENKDDIVGIFYVKDLLDYWESDHSNVTLEKLMRKPYFIPESKPINTLLKEFQEQKLHIAIVLDEYGGTAGIITVEDILEEIVGEITDEHDHKTINEIRHIEKNKIELDARVHVDEINDQFLIDIPDEERYDTIGGFLFSQMGRVPIVGESYRYKNCEFSILKANERRIEKVLMKIFPEEEKETEQLS